MIGCCVGESAHQRSLPCQSAQRLDVSKLPTQSCMESIRRQTRKEVHRFFTHELRFKSLLLLQQGMLESVSLRSLVSHFQNKLAAVVNGCLSAMCSNRTLCSVP